MKFEIVLIAFPFDDFSQTKVKPALLLTESMGAFRHVVAAFISSQVEKNLDVFDIIVSESSADFSQTRLKSSSVIKLHRLITIPEKFMLRSLGFLPAGTKRSVVEKLKILFDL